jgi:hypothetical protein
MHEKTPMPSLAKYYDMLDPLLRETDLSSSDEEMLLLQKMPVQLGSSRVNMAVETKFCSLFI